MKDSPTIQKEAQTPSASAPVTTPSFLRRVRQALTSAAQIGVDAAFSGVPV